MIKGEASDKPSKLIAKTEKAKNLFVLGIISLPAFPVEAYNSYGRLNGYFWSDRNVPGNICVATPVAIINSKSIRTSSITGKLPVCTRS